MAFDLRQSHLTLELLRAVHEGDESPRELATLALGHLLDLCPKCQDILHQWEHEVQRAPEELASLSEQQSTTEPSIALDQASELMALPQLEQVERVRQQPRKFRGSLLAELLLDEVCHCLPERPRQAHSIARLARAVIQHDPSTSENTALYVRALAHEGNAARSQGDLESAQAALETARYLMESQACRNLRAQADLDMLEGPLRRAQRRLDEARDLLARAAEAYAQSGLPFDQVRCLISLGIVFKDLGQLDRAIEVTRKAGEVLERTSSNARLELCWRHNLAVFFLIKGDHRLASQITEEAEELYSRFTDFWTELRRRAAAGLRAKVQGDFQTAEALLKDAREGYLRECRPLDAALIGSDLASLYADQGRIAELEDLSREIISEFEELQVFPAADAARKLLEEATGAGSPPVH